MAWGAGIGADVPFFIFTNPAWAGGKGEKLEAAKLPANLWFLLLVPPFRISTAWAYDAYDRLGEDKPGPFLVKRSFPEVADFSAFLSNDLERASIGRLSRDRRNERKIPGARRGRRPHVRKRASGFRALRGPGGDEKSGRKALRPAGWKAIPAQGI